ncbi:unnamed protein product [Prunus armeniaca]|uniref:BSD2 cysteine rich domain-containing protein n=2 Tax=Prunus TaxID=3754 RepID=A0A6J5XYK4_PRUAR|nr:PREDICTED: uncharacterized protein LOC103341068 [Prunus mume]KAH0970341.1 hypothetical protein GBA52_022497 [Prunus armeniaca]CAB4288613.1 unnamed protein product [Prunus armeniaca]CAB4318980.1 unnamed protein product [Prunus armeniaca]
MASSLSFTPVCSFKSTNKPRVLIDNSIGGKVLRANEVFQNSKAANFQSWEVKATDGNQTTKTNSLVCSKCEGNGAISCSQCKGTGVNSVDHFNGQFKAGGLCWLCRGKRDILCGECNGAGFLGGFMSTHDS